MLTISIRDLRSQAIMLGIPGYPRMDRLTLIKAIRSHERIPSLNKHRKMKAESTSTARLLDRCHKKFNARIENGN